MTFKMAHRAYGAMRNCACDIDSDVSLSEERIELDLKWWNQEV